VTNPNQRKGAETERMVAKYFRDQGFWMADRRLREGRTDDMGDLDGVPFTTVQVKYVESNRYAAWILDTIKQRDTAGTPLCLLVRRVPRKPVEEWEALVPPQFFLADFEYMDGGHAGSWIPLDESEAWTWIRMDLRLAVVALKRVTEAMSKEKATENSLRFWPITWTDSTETPSGTRGTPSVPSTERGTPPSPTT